MKLLRAPLARALVAVALVALAGAAPASGYVVYRLSDGTPLHWPTPEIRYVVGADLPDELVLSRTLDAFERAAEAWSTMPCCPFTFTFEGVRSGLSGAMTDRVNMLLWIHDANAWSARQFGALEVARTIITHSQSTGAIVDADVYYNAGAYQFDDTGQCAGASFDLQAVTAHEMGHMLGIDHSQIDSATMAPIALGGECDKRTLTADDIAAFCTIYGGKEPAPVDEEPAPDVVEPAPDTIRDTAGTGGADASNDVPGDRDRCGAARGGAIPLAWAFALLLSARALARRANRRRP